MFANKINGFTIIEFFINLFIITILLLTILPIINIIKDERRFKITLEKMENIQKAIIGDFELIEKGERVEGGYFSDLGQLPNDLQDLVTNPGISGWNGPYIENKEGYKKDGWGNYFVYDRINGTITSYGSDGAVGGTGYASDITMYIYQPLSNLSNNNIRVFVKDGLNNTLTDTFISVYLKYPYSNWNSLSYNNGYFYLSNAKAGTKNKIKIEVLPSYIADLGENIEEYIVVYPKGTSIQNFYFYLKGSLR